MEIHSAMKFQTSGMMSRMVALWAEWHQMQTIPWRGSTTVQPKEIICLPTHVHYLTHCRVQSVDNVELFDNRFGVVNVGLSRLS